MLKYFIYKITDRILRIHQECSCKKLLKSLRLQGENIVIHQPCFFAGNEFISIGKNSVINAFTHIWGHGGVTIGENCLIASHTVITSLTHNSGSKLFSNENIAKPVNIGNNVWIGSHAIILPGVTIGNNVIIGAGCLVNQDVAENAVYVGMPAKKLYDLDQFISS